jgi:hypothetical protein
MAEQAADGAFATVAAGILTWEVRRELATADVQTSLCKVRIDGPVLITCAFASTSPAEASEVQQRASEKDILCELNLNKEQQLTQRVDEQTAGMPTGAKNAVTLASLSSENATRIWMMQVPAGQHELTVRFRWRVPAAAASLWVNTDCGLALIVQPQR